jgi:hypothetical protein
VRVKAPEHVADDARALDRLRPRRRREREAHPGHRVQDAPLHRLLAIGHVGQRTALDDAERVFKIGTLGVVGDRDGVVGRRRCGEEIEEFGHVALLGKARSVASGAAGKPRLRLCQAPRAPSSVLSKPRH